MKAKTLLFAVVTVIIIMAACTKEKTGSEYNPPADHTISQDGFMHKAGLNDPLNNCATCHGADLSGGNVGVSCFECHGAKWQ
ncbi:MAG: hypothetical protein V2I37_07905 [Marinilabiliaceae bacterium]|jgi:hypothetical protein|nr:hypothetical protein [Marinilabiliaceae bacterium]